MFWAGFIVGFVGAFVFSALVVFLFLLESRQ